MTRYLRLFAYAGLVALTLSMALAFSARAQAATCANVRCASGSCIDTPGGPVCQANQMSCASTLCVQGTTCVETQRGPVCRTNEGPPKMPPLFTPRPYMHPQPHPRPYTHPHVQHPHSGNHQSCRLERTSQYGQTAGGRSCEPIRHYVPDRPCIQPIPSHRPGPRSGQWSGNSNPCPGAQPAPPPGRFCPKIYAPVCAQKHVQCVRAPCPPVTQTFGNGCEAANAGYQIIGNGPCR